jgi:hypothetical protein
MNITQKYAGKKSHHRITKRMNCSPIVKKISVKNSCYTPKILFMIRDAYNADHSSEERIDETDATKLWKILNARLVQCQKEDCWLNEIKDANLKRRIDRYIFAPDKPYEWKNNPNEWLSNFDIMNVLEQYEQTYKHFEFIGPTPIDFDKVVGGTCVQNELCRFQLKDYVKRCGAVAVNTDNNTENELPAHPLTKKCGKTHIGIIFNLSPHTSSGSHWVSLFIDMKERVIFYFDSAGEPIPKEIKEFVGRVQQQAKEINGLHNRGYRFYQNWPKEHQMGNTECGVYSLFFIITMLTGKTEFARGKMSMRQKINLFKKRTIPDKYVEKYRGVYFND